MRLSDITLVLACAWIASGDVTHLKAEKQKFLSRLAAKHHKRGIYSAVPPFKLGHDIPLVTHSVLKPVVVTYPPTAAVTAVKIPVPSLSHRFPVSVGHKVHPHFGIHHPHHTKTFVAPRPDQHFHHHHHHVPPKPVVPLLPPAPAPFIPFAQAGSIVHSLPSPAPTVFVNQPPVAPEPILPPQPLPLPPPPVHLHQEQFPFRQLVPFAPVQAAPAIPGPAFPLAPQLSYVIRPGNAVQTSYFATYPRYPFINYQNSFAAPPASIVPASATPLLFDRPHFHHLGQQAGVHEGFIEQHNPGIAIEPTPTLLHPTQIVPQPSFHIDPSQPPFHVHPTQPEVHLHAGQPTVHPQPAPGTALDHDGWSPVTNSPSPPPDAHYPQPLDPHQYTQEQGTQIYENHTGNDYQDQLQHHLQQQLEQAQYEQHLNNQQHLNQEYGAPNNEFSQQNHDFIHHAEEYAQHVQEYAQHEQEYAQTNEYDLHHQQQQQQEYAQTNEYNLQQQQQEYGPPQQVLEGRSSAESEGEAQRYHNHIPLGLQPPIDRPLEHFR